MARASSTQAFNHVLPAIAGADEVVALDARGAPVG